MHHFAVIDIYPKNQGVWGLSKTFLNCSPVHFGLDDVFGFEYMRSLDLGHEEFLSVL